MVSRMVKKSQISVRNVLLAEGRVALDEAWRERTRALMYQKGVPIRYDSEEWRAPVSSFKTANWIFGRSKSAEQKELSAFENWLGSLPDKVANPEHVRGKKFGYTRPLYEGFISLEDDSLGKHFGEHFNALRFQKGVGFDFDAETLGSPVSSSKIKNWSAKSARSARADDLKAMVLWLGTLPHVITGTRITLIRNGEVSLNDNKRRERLKDLADGKWRAEIVARMGLVGVNRQSFYDWSGERVRQTNYVTRARLAAVFKIMRMPRHQLLIRPEKDSRVEMTEVRKERLRRLIEKREVLPWHLKFTEKAPYSRIHVWLHRRKDSSAQRSSLAEVYKELRRIPKTPEMWVKLDNHSANEHLLSRRDRLKWRMNSAGVMPARLLRGWKDAPVKVGVLDRWMSGHVAKVRRGDLAAVFRRIRVLRDEFRAAGQIREDQKAENNLLQKIAREVFDHKTGRTIDHSTGGEPEQKQKRKKGSTTGRVVHSDLQELPLGWVRLEECHWMEDIGRLMREKDEAAQERLLNSKDALVSGAEIRAWKSGFVEAVEFRRVYWLLWELRKLPNKPGQSHNPNISTTAADTLDL